MSYTISLGYTPVFQIDQDDQDITGGFQDRLVSIMIASSGGNGIDNNSAAKSPVITNYDGKTLGDVVGEIARAAGVTPVVARLSPRRSSSS